MPLLRPDVLTYLQPPACTAAQQSSLTVLLTPCCCYCCCMMLCAPQTRTAKATEGDDLDWVAPDGSRNSLTQFK